MARFKGASLDIHALHLWMWKTRTRENYLSVTLTELAGKLEVEQMTANRYLRWMTSQGRLKKIARSKFIVADPEKYLWEAKLGPEKRNQQGNIDRSNHRRKVVDPDGDRDGPVPEMPREVAGL